MASDQEKTAAKLTFQAIIEGYVNNLLMVQAVNRRMRALNEWATANNKQGDPAVSAVKEQMQSLGSSLIASAKDGLGHINEMAKKDPGIWDTLAQVTKKIDDENRVNNQNPVFSNWHITTAGGTEFTLNSQQAPVSFFVSEVSLGVDENVGENVGVVIVPALVIIVKFVAVAVIVAAVAAAVMTYCLSEGARTHSIAQKRAYTQQLSSIRIIEAEMERIRKADEDLKAGTITQEQHKQVIDSANQNISTASAEAAAVTEAAHQAAKDAKSLGDQISAFFKNAMGGAIAPVAGTLLLGGLLFLAWKMGWIQQLIGSDKKKRVGFEV